jgi:hypothetical protein
MFGELPKLFDRNFIIGFFLPVAIFLTASGLILGQYSFGPDISTYLGTQLLIDTTVISLLAWVGGIVFLAINRDLYRLMEGYGTYNPLKIFTVLEKRRFHRLTNQLEMLDDEYRDSIANQQKFPEKSRTKRNQTIRQLAEEFPDEERSILPTPFGNALRAFEVYPRVMYGLDSIYSWGRLLTVIPKDYFELIEGARAQVDFWVNLGIVFVMLQIEYIAFAFITWTSLKEWVIMLLIMLGAIAQLRATSSAVEWGDFVKSAFDVYRFSLIESLGIDIPRNREEERVLWTKFSQAITYRLAESLPDLKWTPNKPATKKTTSK